MDPKSLSKSIKDNVIEGVYRSNREGIFYVDNAFARLFGFENEEEVYKSSLLNFHEDSLEGSPLYAPFVSSDSINNQEVAFLKKDGEKFTALVNSKALKDENGNLYWDGTVRYITNQLEGKKAVQTSNQFLESINKNINEAIYRSIDGKGLIYVNEAFISMFGYSDIEEIIRLSATHLYKRAPDRKLLLDELKEVGFVSNREMEFERRDGTCFWGSLSAIKIVGEDGTIFFDGAVRDITKQKASEHELMQQAQMQSLLIKISTRYINLPLKKVDDSIQESLKELGEFVGADRAYVFDIDFQKGSWSNTYEWCRDGVTEEKEKSQNLPLKLISDTIDLYVEGKPLLIEERSHVGANDYQRFLEDRKVQSSLSVPIMSGKYCVGFVGFDSVGKKHKYQPQDISLLKVFAELMVNIYNRMQNESELGKLLDTANSQNKRLKDFSYITSHNMRSSVANLMGLINAIEEKPGDSQFIDMLRTTTRKLSEVINNINELLNFEHEISISKTEECDLSRITASTIAIHWKEIQEKKISLSRRIEENLKVEGYTGYFESIVHNLLTNAIKYGVRDESRKIEIAGEKVGTEVKITIKDFGLGIDLDRFKDKIFRLGARFHAKKDQGQGLGLFITKHQVQAMGGRIEVKSQVGVGTTFKVFFNGKKS